VRNSAAACAHLAIVPAPAVPFHLQLLHVLQQLVVVVKATPDGSRLQGDVGQSLLHCCQVSIAKLAMAFLAKLSRNFANLDQLLQCMIALQWLLVPVANV